MYSCIKNPFLLLLLAPLLAEARTIIAPVDNKASLSNHSFKWRDVRDVAKLGGIMNHLRDSSSPDDFFYVVTGDTQHYKFCTRSNAGCLASTNNCDQRTRPCQMSQSVYSNTLQRDSISALIRQMGRISTKMRPKGIVINGDLTEFGHFDELRTYKSYWAAPIQGVTVYPGLGNHDYDNNVNYCSMNHCANRMLYWFKNYIEKKLEISLDYKHSHRYVFYGVYEGSFAYSWDECVFGGCVHFIQLNNYPNYQRTFQYPLMEWKIRSAMPWLRSDLSRVDDSTPIIINFHDFDSSFSAAAKTDLRRELNGKRVLAIMFAHYHSNVGLHPQGYWCLADGRRVPLLYSGSVPANNYALLRLNPGGDHLAEVLLLHADSDHTTSVSPLTLDNRRC